MASSCTWRWSCETHLSCLSAALRDRPRKLKFIRLALEDSSRSSSSSSIGRRVSKISRSLPKPSSETVNEPPKPPQISISASADFSSDELENKGSVAPLRLSRASFRKFNSFFRKRPLWKRIFFASAKVRSIILLNVLTVIYASNIPVVKEVEEIIDPALFTVVRFALSAIPFLPFVFKARGDSQTRNAGMELGFWVSLGYLAQALGLLTSDAGRASFMSAFTVIVVPVIDVLFGASLPAFTWFGAITSVIGVALLESSGSPPSVGDILNLLSAIFFGVHILRTKQISRVTAKEKFLALLGYEVCVVAFLSTMWYLLMAAVGDSPELKSVSWTWTQMSEWLMSFPWIPALYTGIFSTGLCLWVEMMAMRDVSATETAIIYGLEPVWGATFAWFLLGERWGLAGWIGAALVIGGSLTVQILGSISDISEETNSSKSCQHIASERTDFSTSVVTVKSRDTVAKLLKK